MPTTTTIDSQVLRASFNLSPIETETMGLCVQLASESKLPSLAKRLDGMGVSTASMRINALKKKNILDRDEEAGHGHWKFTDIAYRVLQNIHTKNKPIVPVSDESTSQVSDIFANMVYDFLATKMGNSHEIVMDDSLLSLLTSNFEVSSKNMLATLSKLELSERLKRQPRRHDDKGVRLLVNGTEFAPPTLVPTLAAQPVIQATSAKVVEVDEVLTNHAAAIEELLKTEIRQQEETIRGAEYRKNRARELLHALRDFVEG